MVKYNIVLLLLLFVSLLLTSIIFLVCEATKNSDESGKLHIVYMGPLPKGVSYSPTSHHLNLLQQVIDESDIENRLVRSYKRSFNGFAAILNDQQRERLAGMRDVVSVFPSQEVYLQTTRLWDFVGLPQSIKRDQIVESDLVIGVIDSGIWLESESFNDNGTHTCILTQNQNIVYILIIIFSFFFNNYSYVKKISTPLKMIDSKSSILFFIIT